MSAGVPVLQQEARRRSYADVKLAPLLGFEILEQPVTATLAYTEESNVQYLLAGTTRADVLM